MKRLKAWLSKPKEWLVDKWRDFTIVQKDWIATYENRAFLILVAFIFVILILWLVPKWQVYSYRARFIQSDISRLEPKDRVQYEASLITAENNARVTIAQIIGGLVVLLGLYATFKNIRVAEEGKLTERFSKAVELLGSDKLDVRLGGIYALERIARDSLKDHWTVMEVLTAFVREQSHKEAIQYRKFLNTFDRYLENPEIRPKEAPEYKYPTDIQAALTVISRRKWSEQEKPHQRVDLSKSFLRGVNFVGANLDRAIFYGANLESANFKRAKLDGAIFTRAVANSAIFEDAKLVKSIFDRAELNYANLNGAELKGARLIRAEAKSVRLIGTDLSHTILFGADLIKSILFKADLTDADFSPDLGITGNGKPTNLIGAKFLYAKGLTWEQLSETIIDETTELPPELEKLRRAEQAKKAAAPNQ